MEKNGFFYIIYIYKYKKNEITMEKIKKGKRGKDLKPRKVGSGLTKRNNYVCIKGMYKVYGLRDPETMDIMYIGLTKQYLYKRLAYHIYSASKLLYNKSEKDLWIRELLSRGLRPSIVEMERLETKDKREAFEKENEYIKQYGILNKFETHFVDKKTKDWCYVETILSLFQSGYTITDISNKMNREKSMINYWLVKNKINKKVTTELYLDKVKNLKKLGRNYISIARELDLSLGQVYYISKKIKGK